MAGYIPTIRETLNPSGLTQIDIEIPAGEVFPIDVIPIERLVEPVSQPPPPPPSPAGPILVPSEPIPQPAKLESTRIEFDSEIPSRLGSGLLTVLLIIIILLNLCCCCYRCYSDGWPPKAPKKLGPERVEPESKELGERDGSRPELGPGDDPSGSSSNSPSDDGPPPNITPIGVAPVRTTTTQFDKTVHRLILESQAQEVAPAARTVTTELDQKAADVKTAAVKKLMPEQIEKEAKLRKERYDKTKAAAERAEDEKTKLARIDDASKWFQKKQDLAVAARKAKLQAEQNEKVRLQRVEQAQIQAERDLAENRRSNQLRLECIREQNRQKQVREEQHFSDKTMVGTTVDVPVPKLPPIARDPPVGRMEDSVPAALPKVESSKAKPTTNLPGFKQPIVAKIEPLKSAVTKSEKVRKSPPQETPVKSVSPIIAPGPRETVLSAPGGPQPAETEPISIPARPRSDPSTSYLARAIRPEVPVVRTNTTGSQATLKRIDDPTGSPPADPSIAKQESPKSKPVSSNISSTSNPSEIVRRHHPTRGEVRKYMSEHGINRTHTTRAFRNLRARSTRPSSHQTEQEVLDAVAPTSVESRDRSTPSATPHEAAQLPIELTSPPKIQAKFSNVAQEERQIQNLEGQTTLADIQADQPVENFQGDRSTSDHEEQPLDNVQEAQSVDSIQLEQPIENFQEQPVEQAQVEQSVEQTQDEPLIEQAQVDRPFEQPQIEEPVEEPVEKSAEQSQAEQSVKQSGESIQVEEPIEQLHTGQPVEQVQVEQPIEQTLIEQPVEDIQEDQPRNDVQETYEGLNSFNAQPPIHAPTPFLFGTLNTDGTTIDINTHAPADQFMFDAAPFEPIRPPNPFDEPMNDAELLAGTFAPGLGCTQDIPDQLADWVQPHNAQLDQNDESMADVEATGDDMNYVPQMDIQPVTQFQQQAPILPPYQPQAVLADGAIGNAEPLVMENVAGEAMEYTEAADLANDLSLLGPIADFNANTSWQDAADAANFAALQNPADTAEQNNIFAAIDPVLLGQDQNAGLGPTVAQNPPVAASGASTALHDNRPRYTTGQALLALSMDNQLQMPWAAGLGHVGLHSVLGPDAENQVNSLLPHRQSVDVSGRNFECGMRAMATSFLAQHPDEVDRQVFTAEYLFENFLNIFLNYIQPMERYILGGSDPENMGAETLSRILMYWSYSMDLAPFNLGWTATSDPTGIYELMDPQFNWWREHRRIVWIDNNSGDRAGNGALGHWFGLVPVPPPPAVPCPPNPVADLLDLMYGGSQSGFTQVTSLAPAVLVGQQPAVAPPPEFPAGDIPFVPSADPGAGWEQAFPLVKQLTEAGLSGLGQSSGPEAQLPTSFDYPSPEAELESQPAAGDFPFDPALMDCIDPALVNPADFLASLAGPGHIDPPATLTSIKPSAGPSEVVEQSEEEGCDEDELTAAFLESHLNEPDPAPSGRKMAKPKGKRRAGTAAFPVEWSQAGTPLPPTEEEVAEQKAEEQKQTAEEQPPYDFTEDDMKFIATLDSQFQYRLTKVSPTGRRNLLNFYRSGAYKPPVKGLRPMKAATGTKKVNKIVDASAEVKALAQSSKDMLAKIAEEHKRRAEAGDLNDCIKRPEDEEEDGDEDDYEYAESGSDSEAN